MSKSPNPKPILPWLAGVNGTQVLPLIESDEKAIRVEAGPGTGKSFGLARRVARLMHKQGKNVAGKEILIVAFNRVIAKQLKNDISRELAKCGVKHGPKEGPVIRTVHALCLEVIGQGIRLLLPHEKEAMLYDVLEEHEVLRETYTRHRDADQALRDHEAKHEKHPALWAAVTKWLKRHNARLISELPSILLDHIHGGDFEDLEYRHIIVDEFQDLTPCEQLLFAKLKSKNGSFVAMGDSRQSIYTFRGNDRAGLKNLGILLKPAKITDFAMTECMRCPPDVVNAANQLMQLAPGAKITPGNTNPSRIGVLHWDSPDQEAAGLAKIITKSIEANPTDSHLVMVTRKSFGFLLRDRIAEIDPKLPVDLCFSESLLETWPTREAFLLFCLLLAPDEPTWRAWLGYQNCPDAKTHTAPDRNASAYLNFLIACKDNITVEAIKKLAGEPRFC